MSPPPEIVRITHPERGPLFEFNRPVSQDEASRALFGNDGPPTGVTLRPGSSPDEWKVEGLNAWNVGELTGNLPAIVASSTVVVPRAEYDAERAARESANDAAMNEPLPGLGKTAKQIFDEYGPGHHEVNGNFVWIGIKDGEKTIQSHPRSDNETFNKDIQWYLDHGLSLSGAIHKFEQQWNEITAQILRAFGGTLASAGGAGVPVKPPFTMTQALTLGVDAIKTIKTPGDGAYEAVPMPSGDRAQQHGKGTTGETGRGENGQTEKAAPKAGEQQEGRPEPETRAAPDAEPDASAAPDAEAEEGRPGPGASSAPAAEPASYTPDRGADLGANLVLGPGVTLDGFTPAAFDLDSHTGVLGHDDDSGAEGLFDDAGPGVSPIRSDGAAFGDPGSAGADGGADRSVFGDPGAGSEGGSLAPGGGSAGGVSGVPGAGIDGGALTPGGGAGYGGAVPAPDGGGFGDPGAGYGGAVPAPGASGFGDPGAGYDGAVPAPGGGAFGDPGAGHDAGISGPAGGWAGAGGQPAIGPNPGTAAFGGDPGQAFGAGSADGGAAGGGTGAA